MAIYSTNILTISRTYKGFRFLFWLTRNGIMDNYRQNYASTNSASFYTKSWEKSNQRGEGVGMLNFTTTTGNFFHYIESGFLVDHYYDNQNVEKNIKIKTFDVLILPMASKKITTTKIKNINYLWHITFGYQGLWGPGGLG